MHQININAAKFNFEYLPDFARFIRDEKLEEYAHHSIRFSREEDLPLLKPLSKFSEDELVALSMESSRELLTNLVNGTIADYIRNNVRNWIQNKLEVIDKDDVVAEDLTLVFFIRRKALGCFLADYTDDRELKRHILGEIDTYTTQEEVVSYNAYLRMQHEKLNKINADLEFHESLLLEAQEISELGSFYMDYLNPENSIVTPQVKKITGQEMDGDQEEFFNNIHPEDKESTRAAWENAYSEGGTFDFTFRYYLDGTEKRIHSRGLVKVEDGIPVNLRGTLRDITKEHQLVSRLTESEALHKQAEKLTHLGNWSWEIGSDKIIWSDEMFRVYGLEPQSETITFERFLSLIHPDDRERRVTEINEAVATGIVKDYTLKIVNPDGTIKVLKGRGNIISDSNRQPKFLIGTCQDITKEYHMNRELVALNDSLSQKNSELVSINKELESFNYIASHDLQEPLRKIRIYSGRLLEQAEMLPQDSKSSLDKVISSASRMQRLISDLIEFSQISSPAEAFENVSLDDLIHEIKSGFSHVIEEYEAIVRIGQLPEARVIPFQFSQLFTNIIANALKYRRDGVPPEIDITSEIVSEAATGEKSAKGDYLKISVCDNGIGFDSDQKEKIFDLFKRLHAAENYSGTGIGLAICKKIINQHNGFIKADSEKGKGSCFTIFLPHS